MEFLWFIGDGRLWRGWGVGIGFQLAVEYGEPSLAVFPGSYQFYLTFSSFKSNLVCYFVHRRHWSHVYGDVMVWGVK